jgi:hypothetical protein
MTWVLRTLYQHWKAFLITPPLGVPISDWKGCKVYSCWCLAIGPVVVRIWEGSCKDVRQASDGKGCLQSAELLVLVKKTWRKALVPVYGRLLLLVRALLILVVGCGR